MSKLKKRVKNLELLLENLGYVTGPSGSFNTLQYGVVPDLTNDVHDLQKAEKAAKNAGNNGKK